jgi:hypothetical protein
MTPQRKPTALRGVLEVYGSLDQAVKAPASPESVATEVDKLLPEFSANTGWFDDIDRYFFPNDRNEHPTFEQACRRVAERVEDGARLTAQQKSRLLFGLSTAARVQATAPVLAKDDEAFRAAITEGLTAVGRDDGDFKARRQRAESRRERYLEKAKSDFVRPGRFIALRNSEADEDGFVDDATTHVPLCRTAVITVNGLESAVIDTIVESPYVTFDDVKSIVNPFNWNENYPDFFLDMRTSTEPARADAWFRVVEEVGFFGLSSQSITTALKYFVVEGDTEATIDYDLDDPAVGDGQVLVDRGFINIRVKNATKNPRDKGVVARTRKVVHIKDLSPYAQQRLVCITGYGTASQEFLFDSAVPPLRDDPRPHPIVYYRGETAENDPPAGAPEPATHVAATAVQVWTSSVQGLVSDYFDVAEKWMDGELKIDDVTDFSKQVAGRFVSAPWEFLERVNRPRRPGGGS